MFRRLSLATLALAVLASAASADTIAVTEIFENPIGERSGRTWIELFNYGKAPVKLTNWKLLNESGQQCDIPDHTIEPGDYLIMVFGSHRVPGVDKKEIFEQEWLGGKSDDRVFGVPTAIFDVGLTGEVIVRNNRRQVVWSVAWKNDSKAGRGTWFASDRFFPKSYGNKAKPGVVRKGNDAGITGGELPGYESNDLTSDPHAFESNPSGLLRDWGVNYEKCGKGVASPLKGDYKTQ